MTIIAVTKRQPADAIVEARQAGLCHFGANYLQEALEQIPVAGPDAIWHFIGPVQANKTRAIASNFDWVHTVASRRVAERLSAQRPEARGPLQICIQLRPHGSAARHGVQETGLAALVRDVVAQPNLQLRGLMMMPLPDPDPDAAAGEFSRARRLLDQLRDGGLDVDTLSMGMSADLEAAIIAGSTCIRIGTDLFGPRNYG